MLDQSTDLLLCGLVPDDREPIDPASLGVPATFAVRDCRRLPTGAAALVPDRMIAGRVGGRWGLTDGAARAADRLADRALADQAWVPRRLKCSDWSRMIRRCTDCWSRTTASIAKRRG